MEKKVKNKLNIFHFSFLEMLESIGLSILSNCIEANALCENIIAKIGVCLVNFKNSFSLTFKMVETFWRYSSLVLL